MATFLPVLVECSSSPCSFLGIKHHLLLEQTSAVTRPQDCIVKEHALSITFLHLDIYRHLLPFIEKTSDQPLLVPPPSIVPRHSDLAGARSEINLC
eukprot:scaffold13769_cov92-Skeletonema_dohrnii-CCMP3373.AAC.1